MSKKAKNISFSTLIRRSTDGYGWVRIGTDRYGEKNFGFGHHTSVPVRPVRPLIEPGQERGGSRSCCPGCPDCSCPGPPHGSSQRCCPNCPRVTRGSIHPAVPLDLLLPSCHHSRQRCPDTIPIHSRSYHTNRVRWAFSLQHRELLHRSYRNTTQLL